MNLFERLEKEIENDLGISWEVYLGAKEKGIWVKEWIKRRFYTILSHEQDYFVCTNNLVKNGKRTIKKIKLKDYKIKWALTREELEK